MPVNLPNSVHITVVMTTVVMVYTIGEVLTPSYSVDIAPGGSASCQTERSKNETGRLASHVHLITDIHSKELKIVRTISLVSKTISAGSLN